MVLVISATFAFNTIPLRLVKEMAGNFWKSSHFQQWLLDRQDLLRERHQDLEIFSEEGYQKLMIFFANFIQAIGVELQVRQQVNATATVYFKRFYVRNSLKCIDPLLMAPTCIFLASKVEEYGLISSSVLIKTCRKLVENDFAYAYSHPFPYQMAHVLECEFSLLEMMDCCLVLYHPYRPLVCYVKDIVKYIFKDIQEATIEEYKTMAWKVINDSLRTDVCLLYPPHQIALACLYMACVILGRDCKQWFAELNVDMEKVLEISRQILSLYDMWKEFDEKKEVPVLLSKVPKPKMQPILRYIPNYVGFLAPYYGVHHIGDVSFTTPYR